MWLGGRPVLPCSASNCTAPLRAMQRVYPYPLGRDVSYQIHWRSPWESGQNVWIPLNQSLASVCSSLTVPVLMYCIQCMLRSILHVLCLHALHLRWPSYLRLIHALSLPAAGEEGHLHRRAVDHCERGWDDHRYQLLPSPLHHRPKHPGTEDCDLTAGDLARPTWQKLHWTTHSSSWESKQLILIFYWYNRKTIIIIIGDSIMLKSAFYQLLRTYICIHMPFSYNLH